MECVDLLDEGNPQIYTTCGRGVQSSLRIVRHGLQVAEMATSPMPDVPTGIWTIKERFGDDFDKYMIVSFEQATLVLSIGSKVSEITDSGFDNQVSTLHSHLLQDDSIIQITNAGIIHINSEKKRSMWQSSKGSILHATSNEKQVIIACEGGELTYFELDAVTGELGEIDTKTLDSEITCLDVGPIQEGRQRSRFIAVGCEN
jgi:splicing factor 3B subunit 3